MPLALASGLWSLFGHVIPHGEMRVCGNRTGNNSHQRKGQIPLKLRLELQLNIKIQPNLQLGRPFRTRRNRNRIPNRLLNHPPPPLLTTSRGALFSTIPLRPSILRFFPGGVVTGPLRSIVHILYSPQPARFPLPRPPPTPSPPPPPSPRASVRARAAGAVAYGSGPARRGVAEGLGGGCGGGGVVAGREVEVEVIEDVALRWGEGWGDGRGDGRMEGDG